MQTELELLTDVISGRVLRMFGGESRVEKRRDGVGLGVFWSVAKWSWIIFSKNPTSSSPRIAPLKTFYLLFRSNRSKKAEAISYHLNAMTWFEKAFQRMALIAYVYWLTQAPSKPQIVLASSIAMHLENHGSAGRGNCQLWITLKCTIKRTECFFFFSFVIFYKRTD